MNNLYTNKSHTEKNCSIELLENVIPIKLTVARSLKFNTICWGLLTDYYLESVKINAYESGMVTSSAVLRVGDRSGQVTCVVKGPTVGLLFGLSQDKWNALELLSKRTGQLFYRSFKDGLHSGFSVEQKVFYYFCSTKQRKDVLLAVFQRTTNKRKYDKNEVFLQILELQKCNDSVLDLYRIHLTKDE